MKWTAAQQAAIDAPRPGPLENQTLLVAAAAGSGKTAVLVERIMSRIQDAHNRLDVSELLVLTFTKAAASEMRSRIERTLSDAFAKTQEPWLEEQLRKLPSAQISTLHSFCQWVIRNYFYELDMDPTFRVGNEGEQLLLREEVLDDLLEEAYKENKYSVYTLADIFNTNRSDQKLREIILRIYDFSRAQPNPERWIAELPTPYGIKADEPLQDTIWGKVLWEQMTIERRSYVDAFREIQRANDQEVPIAILSSYIANFGPIMKGWERATSWDEVHQVLPLIDNMNLPTQWRAKKQEKEMYGEEYCKGLNAKVNDIKEYLVNNLRKSAFSLGEDTWKEQIRALQPVVAELASITLAFGAAFAEAKKKEGMVDFSDLEHLCLRLLVGEDGKLSNVATELQQTFKEIMIDEYQDTNGVQEAIVKAVSKKDNRFYVGDVKQSIYGFRMADPSLFLAKYKDYATGDDGLTAQERRIDLSQNFRSHENVLACTNFIFSQIMTEEAAELDYGPDEALYPGREVLDPPSNWVGGPVEIHLVETNQSTDDNVIEDGQESLHIKPALDSFSQEVLCIRDQILALVKGNKVIQEPDGTYAPLEWRHIVVLLRSTTGRANTMVEAFRTVGIPAYAEENTGYFGAIEVQLMVCLLQIIDNPEQDLPMASVLRSPLVGIEVDEIGRLRGRKEGSLWQTIKNISQQEEQMASYDTLCQFAVQLEKWRTMSRRKSVSDLIWHIYEDTYYREYVSAMPNGLVRRANLDALYERAKQYESGSFRGIFRFLRFFESLRDAGEDLSIAKTVSESDNVVRIMSIHKSKGLEFPVVFVSNVGKKFNIKDQSESILLHKTTGLGLKGYFEELKVTYPSVPWLGTKRLLDLASKAEEMRILYVALTRARDKLYITGSVNTLAKEVDKVRDAYSMSTPKLPKYIITEANSYLKWILMTVGRHIDGSRLRAESGVVDGEWGPLPYKDSRWSITVHQGSALVSAAEEAEEIEKTSTIDRKQKSQSEAPLPDYMVDRLLYAYPYEGSVNSPAKISVTEIKRRFAEQEEEALPYGAYEAQEHEIEEHNESEGEVEAEAVEVLPEFSYVPRLFVEEEESAFDGASRGTLMHSAMQWLPLQKYSRDSLTQALDDMVVEGVFAEEERRVLNEQGIYRFFQSDIASRMMASPRIEKELSFSLLLDANRYYTDVEPGERLFLQGIMDVAFTEPNPSGEGDAWVLVDYKTDHVSSASVLTKRYAVQLQLYKEALEKLTQLPVKDVYIYSFALGEAILFGAIADAYLQKPYSPK